MTDHDTDPPPDPLVAILSELTSAHERLAELVANMARSKAQTMRNTEALIRQFIEHQARLEAGELEAAKARLANNRTLELLVHEVKRIGTRFTDAERDIDELKGALLSLRAPTKNGASHD